jgi:UDP-glucose 4-epimerase
VNVSTDNQIAIGELISRICRELGYNGEIVPRDARKADVLCHNASSKKIRKLIDYRLTPFNAGLRETLDWYRGRIAQHERHTTH